MMHLPGSVWSTVSTDCPKKRAHSPSKTPPTCCNGLVNSARATSPWPLKPTNPTGRPSLRTGPPTLFHPQPLTHTMADYFTNFSFIVDLANTEQRDHALTLFLQMSAIEQGEGVPANFPDNLREACED